MYRALLCRRGLCLSSFLFLICVCIPMQASAGPWSRDTGRFYAKVNQAFIFSSDTIDPAKPGIPFFGSTTSLYGEVGLLYGLTLQGSLPFTVATHTSRTNPNEFYQLGGFGDAELGLQWTPPPLQKLLKFPVAVRVNLKLPLYDTQMLNRVKDLSVSTSFPFLGEGQIDLTFWLSIGGSIPNTPLYMFGEIGYKLRTGAYIGDGFSSSNTRFLDTFMFQYQAGYKFFNRVLVMLNVRGAFPLGSELAPLTKGFVGVGLGLYITLYKGLALEATFDPLVHAINSDRSIGFSVGLSYQY